MREKEKGFTLIELLAVIVILAVVALIATPIVLNLINVAKQGAFKRSAEGLLRASSLYYSSSLLQVSGPEDIIFTCHNNECISNNNGKQEKLEISGNVGDGYVKIYSDGDVEMLVTDENHYAAKTKVGDITVDKGNGSDVDLTNDTTSPIINSVNTSVTTNSITVTVGAKDNESGIYGYEYSIDNGATYTEIQRNNAYTFEGLTNDKEYEVRVKVYNGTYGKDTYSDEKGMSQSESKLISLKAIDTPEIKVTPEGWSLEKEITIDYKGAQIKEYSIDNGQTYVEYTNSFKVTENINIVAKASDGQNEVTITETISKIDRELPTVEVSDINTGYETKDEITLTLNDNLSGVTHYCVTSENISDNCNWISGNGNITHTINSNGKYYAYSKDLVGNISEGKEFVIDKIDTEEPTASLELESKTTNSITVKATCTDNVGITTYEYSKDNGVSYEVGTNDTYTFSGLTTGTYNMKVRCSDAAGNSAVGNVTINTEDLGVPSISVSNSGVWSTSKTVTIDYNDTININEYRIESGSATKEDGTALTVGTWYQTSNKEEKVIFTSNGNISVRKSDGTNTLTPVSQNVSMIDTTVPTVSYSVVGGAYNSYQTVRITPNDENYDYMMIHVWKNGHKLDSKSIDYTTNPYYDVNLDSDGDDWLIHVIAYDKAGNKQNQEPNNGHWYYQLYVIDTVTPMISINSGTKVIDGDTNATDNVYSVTVGLSGGTVNCINNTTGGSVTTYDTLILGLNNITCTVTNGLGQSASASGDIVLNQNFKFANSNQTSTVLLHGYQNLSNGQIQYGPYKQSTKGKYKITYYGSGFGDSNQTLQVYQNINPSISFTPININYSNNTISYYIDVIENLLGSGLEIKLYALTDMTIDSVKIEYVGPVEEYVSDGLLVHYDGYNKPANNVWNDLSGNGNNGILYNFSSLDGSEYNSVYFNGSDYISGINNNPLYSESNKLPDMTVEIIFKKTISSWGDVLSFNHFVNENNSYMDLWTTISEDSRGYEIMYGFKSQASFQSSHSLGWDSYPLGSMVKISYSKEGNIYKTYVGDKEVDSQTLDNMQGFTTNSFKLGIAENGWNFTGHIYSVRIYNRALTSDEIISNNNIDKYRFGV